ncbi:hypothetical protein Tco_0943335 [Tanacetum coccineum]
MSDTEQPESTVNEYLTRVRDDNGPGIVKPLFEENIKFEFWGQCIDELKDNVMLMAFPFTLKGKARLWINRLSGGSITTCDLLKNAFLSKYRPPSQIIRQTNAIRNFGQECNEPLHLAWEPFNDLLYNSPEHKINEHEQIQIFYQGLDSKTMQKEDFKGPIPRMTPAAGIKAIDELSKHFLSWYKEEEYKKNENIIDLSILDNIQEIIPSNHINSVKPMLDHLPAEIREDCNNSALFTSNINDEEKPTPKFKELPSHLEYAFPTDNRELPELVPLSVLTKMKENSKPTVQPQRRLNPNVQDVVKAEIVKLLGV